MSDQKFLLTVGWIDTKQTLTLHPGYLLSAGDDDAAHQKSLSQPFVTIISAKILDDNKTLVSEYSLPAIPLHTHPMVSMMSTSDGSGLLMVGKIPLTSSARTIDFYLKDTLLKTQTISKNVPQVSLTWQPGQKVEGKQDVSWTGSHPEQLPLAHVVCYSYDGGKTYQPVSLSTSLTKHTIDFDQLAGGDGQIIILTTDGANSIETRSPVFKVAIKPCYAVIKYPMDGSTFFTDDVIVFSGHGYLREERMLETTNLNWRSSIDGALGTGMVVDATLSPGKHTITLTASSGDRQNETTIQVTINKRT